MRHIIYQSLWKQLVREAKSSQVNKLNVTGYYLTLHITISTLNHLLNVRH